MGRNKIILYGLLLLAVILVATAVFSAGTSQARYVNTDSWFTSLSVAPASQVASNCLIEGGQTVLLGQMELAELRVPFVLDSTDTAVGTLTWDVEAEKADYLQAGVLLNEQPAVKLTNVELEAGENAVELQLIPTEQALTTVHGEMTVTVTVSWITETQTLTADFRVTLPAVAELPEEPADPDVPEETVDPDEGADATEPEPSDTQETGEAQEPGLIPQTEDTADPTEPEETTEPAEPEETTAPTEPEETTAPTEPEETTAPTEPEETTAPTEPEETTAPTEPEETTAPTQPEETAPPTEPEEPSEPQDPVGPEVEPVSPVQIRSLAAFFRDHYLPVVISVPQGTDRVVLTRAGETGAAADLLPFTRYSTDGGSSWYLLYYGGTIELAPQTATQASMLLDLSGVTGELTQLDLLATGYASGNAVGTGAHTAQQSDVISITAASHPWILSDKRRLVLQLNPAWSGCDLEYTVEMLTADKDLETVGYSPVELTEKSLYAVRDTQESMDTLTFRVGKELPPAGSYRITFTWKFEDLCFATEQTSFFINYSPDAAS